MKKDNYNEIFSKQKDLQDKLDFNEIKDSIEIETKPRINLLKFFVPISLFVLLITMFTITVITFNNKNNQLVDVEYQEAIAFFESNQLDYNTLTRDEVVDVYKDVYTNSFELKITSFVIKKAIEENAIKISDEIDELDSDTTRDYWEYFLELHKKKKENTGIYYDFLNTYEKTSGGGIVSSGVIFTKYNNAEVVWSIKFDYLARSCIEVSDHVLVYGSSIGYPSHTGFISKVTSDGDILWTSSIGDVNGVSLIKEIDNKYLGLSTFNGSTLKMYYISYDGEISLFNTIEFAPRKITKIAKVEDNFMLSFSDYSFDMNGKTTYEELLIKIDNLGNIIKDYTYSDDVYEYKLISSCEYKGEMYFAGYRYKKYESMFRRGEINEVLENIFNKQKNGEEVTEEYVLSLLKNNYEAILFKYDKDLDGLKIIETVEEALSQDILVEDGKLVWELASFVWAYFSPATSSFTIGGICDIYNYVLDNGEYYIVKTDETVLYRR